MISNYPEAIALIGSVLVVCGTAIKIFASKRVDSAAKRADVSEADALVQATEIKQLQKEVEHLHKCVDKMQNNFIRLLTENWKDDE